jgi:CheY-like chemotaxis protein
MGNTILCIEDNPDNMMLLSRILGASGYTLKKARTGLDGLAIADAEPVDLILLDINLPDIDGYEIARRLRANPNENVRNLPIIVISANALKGDDQKALALGVNVYLSKPIDITELYEKVELFLPSPKKQMSY